VNGENKMRKLLLLTIVIALTGKTNYSQQPENIKHYIVADEA
jgi:hypothetical protein